FLDQRLSLGFDIYHHTSSFLSTRFSEQRSGADVRMEKALTEFVRVSLQYSLDSITENVSTNSSLEVRTQDGSHTRSAVAASLIFDARDSVFLTTRGNRTEVTAEAVGGPLGGTESIYKLSGKTTFFFPLFSGQVLELLAQGGVVDAFGSTRGSGPIITE